MGMDSLFIYLFFKLFYFTFSGLFPISRRLRKRIAFSFPSIFFKIYLLFSFEVLIFLFSVGDKTLFPDI